ncbi:MAG: hypothetical protein R2795_25065 [Saprospiraceae bacterium]
MNRILTFLGLMLLFNLTLEAQRPDQIVLTPTHNGGAARMCNNDAGNIVSFGLW